MRFRDLQLLAWRQLKERRLRTALTSLAVTVGVIMIIVLSSQVEGIRSSIISTLQKLGPDTIAVIPQGGMPITQADVVRIASVSGVSRVIPSIILNVKVSGLDERVNLMGVRASDLEEFLGEVKVKDGSLYPDAATPQALIGYNVAYDETGRELYKAGQPIIVKIGNRSLVLTISGVLEEYGGSMIITADDSIFVPLDYLSKLARGIGYNLVIVKASSPEQVEDVTKLLRYVFGGRATVMSVQQITSTVNAIISQINLLLVGIASTSFIAAALGTLNIMMVSVLERVREIGILKALGMRDKEVLTLYMSQGLMIGVIGSVIGVFLGVGLSYVASTFMKVSFSHPPTSTQSPHPSFIASYTPIISPIFILLATLISIVVTLIATAYPAWRASKLDPVEALRYE